jgi:RHH-type transcriptional regulator, rel operon repressor / antitoxin RelB
MSNTISLRLPDAMAEQLNELCEQLDRSKSYIIKKALEEYLSEFSDYLVAQGRLNDKNDKIISSDEMRTKLGL